MPIIDEIEVEVANIKEFIAQAKQDSILLEKYQDDPEFKLARFPCSYTRCVMPSQWRSVRRVD